MTMTTDLLTQGDVERMIVAVSDELESETERYSAVSELSADAEADFKGTFAVATIEVANTNRGDRTVTVNERDAIAHQRSADEFRRWKLLESRRAASREALLSLRARIDALRTLASNLRHLT